MPSFDESSRGSSRASSEEETRTTVKENKKERSPARMWVGPPIPSKSPVLKFAFKSGDRVDVTMMWEAAMGMQKGTFWYEIDMCIEGQYRNIRKVDVNYTTLKRLKRGELLKFRYRVSTQTHYGVPSPMCTCIIDYPVIEPTPLDLQVQPMSEFARNYSAEADIVGTGAFGNVIRVTDEHGKHYAAKIMKTSSRKKRDAAQREFDIMRYVNHKSLVQLIAAYAEPKKFIILTELYVGGELFERVASADYITEAACIEYVRQICEGVTFLHYRRIAHLDLKAENIMCVSADGKYIKIIDFGLAHRYSSDKETYRTMYGTRDYAAPEIVNYDKVTYATDMWSIGVITYILLSGLLPFYDDQWTVQSAQITSGEYKYDEEVFENISARAKNFIDNLLVVKQAYRMKAIESLSHRWLAEDPGNREQPLDRAQENLRKYLMIRKWRKEGNQYTFRHGRPAQRRAFFQSITSLCGLLDREPDRTSEYEARYDAFTNVVYVTRAMEKEQRQAGQFYGPRAPRGYRDRPSTRPAGWPRDPRAYYAPSSSDDEDGKSPSFILRLKSSSPKDAPETPSRRPSNPSILSIIRSSFSDDEATGMYKFFKTSISENYGSLRRSGEVARRRSASDEEGGPIVAPRRKRLFCRLWSSLSEEEVGLMPLIAKMRPGSPEDATKAGNVMIAARRFRSNVERRRSSGHSTSPDTDAHATPEPPPSKASVGFEKNVEIVRNFPGGHILEDVSVANLKEYGIHGCTSKMVKLGDVVLVQQRPGIQCDDSSDTDEGSDFESESVTIVDGIRIEDHREIKLERIDPHALRKLAEEQGNIPPDISAAADHKPIEKKSSMLHKLHNMPTINVRHIDDFDKIEEYVEEETNVHDSYEQHKPRYRPPPSTSGRRVVDSAIQEQDSNGEDTKHKVIIDNSRLLSISERHWQLAAATVHSFEDDSSDESAADNKTDESWIPLPSTSDRIPIPFEDKHTAPPPAKQREPSTFMAKPPPSTLGGKVVDTAIIENESNGEETEIIIDNSRLLSYYDVEPWKSETSPDKDDSEESNGSKEK